MIKVPNFSSKGLETLAMQKAPSSRGVFCCPQVALRRQQKKFIINATTTSSEHIRKISPLTENFFKNLKPLEDGFRRH